MRQWIGSHLTFANIVSLAALFVALGGTATAVTYVVSSNSQIGPGTVSGNKPPSGKHSNIIAGSINGNDVADNSLHGADIAESTLGQVPSAAKANDAFSTFHDAAINMPDSLTALGNPIGDLSIPHAGKYVVSATLEANITGSGYIGNNPRCVLSAGGDSDTHRWGIYAYYDNAALQVVHSFDSGGLVQLACTDEGTIPMTVSQIKITAVEVNNLTNSGF